MGTTVKNLTSLLELPGLANLVSGYSNCSIKADNRFLNRRQLKHSDRKRMVDVFCYGDLILNNPSHMFADSVIRAFTSKGTVTLNGYAHSMFSDARFFNSDLSKWNVENVKTMGFMFRNAARFKSDLSRWNVGNVANMTNMFDCATFFNSDLSKWNVSKNTSMQCMFIKAHFFNSDLSKWNVENVTDMSAMFAKAHSFNSDLSKWNVGNVTNMSCMFKHAMSFNSDLSEWNVEKVENIDSFIYGATIIDQTLLPNFKL